MWLLWPRTTLLSRRVSGTRATSTYPSDHLTETCKHSEHGWLSDVVVVLDLGTRGYVQLHFLAPPCKRVFWFTMATAFTAYYYKSLEKPTAIPLTLKLVCKQAADVCISRPASDSNHLSCLYSSRALTIPLPANDSHAPSRSLEGSRRGQY